ncbi:MAG: hypothetical protein ACXABF_14425 [Candidatus Thorarchaeota archaeon]|jgi:hypothetical protein
MSNGILVDSLEEGNVNNQADELTVEVEAKAPPAEDKPGFEMPSKFEGKSAEEIAQAYVNAEKRLGEVNNQLGEYRSMTDRLLDLEEKRVSDLEKGGATEIESYDIDPTELLANPQDDNYQALQQRLDRIESHSIEQQFVEKHPDAQERFNDPAFVEWVQANPYRANMAAQAVQAQDYNGLDYLLTDYKERTGAAPANDRKAQEIRQAAQVATESQSSGSSTNSGKVYSRRKIVELKITNPEEYRMRASEFTKAYAEGRVTD